MSNAIRSGNPWSIPAQSPPQRRAGRVHRPTLRAFLFVRLLPSVALAGWAPLEVDDFHDDDGNMGNFEVPLDFRYRRTIEAVGCG